MNNETPEDVMQFVAKFEAVRNGGGVRRYHTHHVNKEDTVASHSWGVATLVDMLYEGTAPAHVLRAALYHDIAEFQCGDIPSPTKRLPRSEELRKMEDMYMRDVGLFTELAEHERRVLKLADILEGLSFCSEELARGNRGLVEVWNRYHEYAKELLGRITHTVNEDTSETEADVYVRACKVCGQIFGCIQAKVGALA